MKVPISAHFCCGVDPLNIVRYRQDSQNAHLWPETQDWPRNDQGAWRENQNNGKNTNLEKHKLGDWTSHIFAETTHVAWPHQDVMWDGVQDIVYYAKPHQNQFRGFGSLRSQNLTFFLCIVLWLYNRLGQLRNLWASKHAQLASVLEYTYETSCRGRKWQW